MRNRMVNIVFAILMGFTLSAMAYYDVTIINHVKPNLNAPLGLQGCLNAVSYPKGLEVSISKTQTTKYKMIPGLNIIVIRNAQMNYFGTACTANALWRPTGLTYYVCKNLKAGDTITVNPKDPTRLEYFIVNKNGKRCSSCTLAYCL